jgi:hypothetical protein
MPCRAHPSESEALKERNEDFFNEIVFAGFLKERCQLLSLLDLLWRQWAGYLRKRCCADAGPGAAQVTASGIVEVGNQPLALDQFIERGQSLLKIGDVIRIAVSTILELIVVPLKIIGVKKLRNHVAEIVGREVGGLAVAKIELGEPFLGPERSGSAVVNKRQTTSRKELGYVIAAPVGKVLRIPNHHPGEFFKRAFGEFHGVEE